MCGVVQIRPKENNRAMSTGDNDRIMLAHGGGGRLWEQLLNNNILPKMKNDVLTELGDSAALELSSSSICFTTDSYVVKPLFFNGGDIGKLAVCGTVNDLAVAGAKPTALSLSFIIEEGFELRLFDEILSSIAEATEQNNVSVVTGDTKVVERGAADKIFINTAGLGVRQRDVDLSFGRIDAGDKVIINGTIGDHGMTIMSQREGLKFQSSLKSDCAGLAGLIGQILRDAAGVKFMRDPTRGGLAATLNEISAGCGFSIEINESAVPVNPTVWAAADMLGFDVLNIANEGKFIAIVKPSSADKLLDICKKHPLGKQSAIIGEIVENSDGRVVELLTKIGGRRIIQTPYGRELPRIC